MSIVNHLPCSAMVGEPFADYLNISVPIDSAGGLRDSLLTVLYEVGSFDETQPGIFRQLSLVVRSGKIVTESLGSVRFSRRGKVEIVSTSGCILRLLREKGRFLDYLAVIGSYPYRVTMLHVTADYLCPSVPAVVAAVKIAALSGSLSLTRKSLQPSHCSYLGGIDVDGQETGTVYLGKRENADVWAKVYDKRHERLSRGFADPGSLLRVEVALQSDVGVTLRDVHHPADVFFQYAGKSLVAVPDGFAGWESHAEGFVLPPRPERTPYERFHAFVSGNLDLRRAAEMAVDVYGADVAPQVLGRVILALIGGVGVVSPENVT